MKVIAGVGFALISCFTTANATEECGQTPSDTKRLSCDDRAFKEERLSPQTDPQKGTDFNALLREKLSSGNWQKTESKNKLDDKPTVILSTTSISTAPDRYGQPKSLYLILRCDEGITVAYINFANHFMADLNGGGRVDYRVDDKKAKSKSFEESNNHETLGLWSSKSSLPWIKELFGGKTLFVRATPHSANEVTGEFSITGLERAIEPLRTACKW